MDGECLDQNEALLNIICTLAWLPPAADIHRVELSRRVDPYEGWWWSVATTMTLNNQWQWGWGLGLTESDEESRLRWWRELLESIKAEPQSSIHRVDVRDDFLRTLAPPEGTSGESSL